MTQALAPTRPQPTQIRHRKDVDGLDDTQLGALRDAFTAVMAISDDRGYQYLAGIHGLPLPMYCQHGPTLLFLPWHRAYLYAFELALQDHVSEATLAWWDWTSPTAHATGIPAAFGTARLANGPNPLYAAPVQPAARQNGKPTRSTRAPQPPAGLPTTNAVNQAMAARDFGDFSTQLQNLHDAVHGWVGGTMGIIPWAAYDPIFWAHHAMIDRLWRMWQLDHPNALPPQAILDQALPPFAMTVRQTLDATALGYDYAVTSSHASLGGGK